ncbi:MAG: hypothetical protein ACQKBU_11040, partial [Verrucomicrobiales bacterium]
MKLLRLSPFFLTATLASAQVYTPPPAQNEVKHSANTGGDTVINRQPEPKNDSPFLGNELPFMDPNSEMVSWNGSTWAATDNRLMAARFERYLNEPEDDSEDAREYRQTIEEILENVSPHHPGGPDFAAAVSLLPRASSFPGDAKLCDSLSQAIYAAVLAKKDVRATRALNDAMNEEKRRILQKADWKAAREIEPALTSNAQSDSNEKGNRNKGNKGNSNSGISSGRGSDSLEYKEAIRRATEIEALRKTNTAKNEVQ